MPLQSATYIDVKHGFVNVPGSSRRPKMSVREPGPLDNVRELRQLQVASRRSSTRSALRAFTGVGSLAAVSSTALEVHLPAR